jgi:hypothetical protein
MAQWAHFGRGRAPFHLYVPAAAVDIARRLCVENQVGVSEIWSYHAVGDQTRFMLVQRMNHQPPRSAAPRSAAPRSAAPRAAAVAAPAKPDRPAAKPAKKPAPAAKAAKAKPAAKAAKKKPAKPAKAKSQTKSKKRK